jgi:hypothetical protein
LGEERFISKGRQERTDEMKKKAHSAEFKFKVVLEEIRWQKTRGRSCATNWGCEQQPDFQVEAGYFEPWDGGI